MKITMKVWTALLLVLLLCSGGQTMAAQGSSGPPDGGGPGDHGRKKDSDEQGTLMGLIFGDQWVIVRDVSAAGDGQPIYFTWTWPEEAYNEEGDFDPQLADLPLYDINVEVTAEPGCVQPVSFVEVVGLWYQFEISEVAEISTNYYDNYGRVKYPTYLIPLDPECKIPEAFEESWGELVMEADAGRFNLSRSPQDVLDAAYEEVLMAIDQALSFGLGPAGRLLLELPMVDEFGNDIGTIMKTVDSPRENLALYQRVLLERCLPVTYNIFLSDDTKELLISDGLGHLICDGSLPTDADFQRAASFLGGAGDKTGRITLDLLVYLNDRLELNEIIWAANKKEVEDIIFYDFQDFSYDRCDEHAATTAALLQPADNAVDYPQSFSVEEDVTIFDKRFVYSWPTEPCMVNSGPYYLYDDIDADTPIINFVRAADDALVIIDYIHNYELPAYPLAPVPEVD